MDPVGQGEVFNLRPRAWVKSITFSDQTRLEFASTDVVVVVGPNNSGKSATLRGIREKLNSPDLNNFVVKEVIVEREGTHDEVIAWLSQTAKRVETGDTANPSFQSLGGAVQISRAREIWKSTGPLRELTPFFCHLLTADERLQAANPPNSIAIASHPPQHPIHFLQRDDSLELKLSEQFKRAFGVDLVVHRNAGSHVPIHVGRRPIPKAGQDRASLDYNIELERLPALQGQGDGMRSFGGVLLYSAVSHESIFLVDEPEAFLHPPQARHLGRVLATENSERQVFIATHSGDVLRGVLDSESKRVRVLRVRRVGEVNFVRELDNSCIVEVWSDPLLRYSNILDGLFHEKVIVCESDSDCRFYAAVGDAYFEATQRARKPDVMFTHCGGKSRLPLVIRALRDIEVPTAVVSDFDVLNEIEPLRSIVKAAGGTWTDIEASWREVKNAVDSIKPELSTKEVKKEIEHILTSINDQMFPAEARRRIQEVLRRSSPWSTAKSVGMPFVPNGNASQACNELLAKLEQLGIFVVPVGELEGFCKSVGAHGPSWVAKVLKRNLAEDNELKTAREFVQKILLSTPSRRPERNGVPLDDSISF